MQSKVIRWYLLSAVTFVMVASLAKLISSLGTSRILDTVEPVFGIPFKFLLRVVGSLELVCAIICMLINNVAARVVILAYLATCFALYRLALFWLGYQKPCSCLGNLTDALLVPPETVDNIMRGILVYLLVGSYTILIMLWRRHRKNSQ